MQSAEVVWAIKDWDEVFESNRTREVVGPLNFVLLQTVRQSDAYLALMRSRDGMIAYAVFSGLCRIAARCPKRGVLATERGPLTAEVIGQRLGIASALVRRSIDVLSAANVAWVRRRGAVVTADAVPMQAPIGGGDLDRIGSERIKNPPTPAKPGGCVGKDSPSGDKPPTVPADPPGFSAWWSAYPSRRKAARRQCREVWVRQALEASAPAIMAGLERWRRSADWAKDGGQYIPAPVVWLRQARWEAEPDPATGAKAVPSAEASEAAERGREVLRGMGREQRREAIERFRGEVLRGMQVTYCIEDTTRFLVWLAGAAVVNGGTA